MHARAAAGSSSPSIPPGGGVDEAVPRRRWASAEGQHGAVSSGPALAMPGKAQHFQGPQVSCCAKYLLFASNVLFWVGEREQASESRPAEAVGRSVGAALAPLPPGRRGGGQEDGATGLWLLFPRPWRLQ